MNYKKIYNSIIDRALNREAPIYNEEHHIVPKCLGGLDDKSNLVLLTPEEHFLCHLLLVKIYPNNSKLIFAANMMSVSNGLQKRFNNKRYGWLKKLHQKVASENGKKNKGRKFNKEQRENIRKSKLGSKNPMFGITGEKHHSFGKPNKFKGKKYGKRTKPFKKYLMTPEHRKKVIESGKKNKAPTFNTKGYEILTPTGFKPFHGVSYNGLVECLKFITSTNKSIIVSKKHKFNTEKLAKDYKINDEILTKDGIEIIVNIENVGKKQVFDVLEVGEDHLYLANDFVNHNCRIITDDNYAIVPEFSKVKENIIKDWKRKPFYDGYVSMDIGVKDLTVVLFAWYDFQESKIIIEDEFVINGQKFNTNSLAEGIKQKETQVFTDKLTGEQYTPSMRVSDTSLTVINDLWFSHSLRFLPTRKDDADAALNKVRMMIQNEQIIINPRCKTLIMHLESGIWNKSKTSYERSADFGHFDAIDALKYLIRNVNLTKNPYPKGFFITSKENEFVIREQQHKESSQWGKIMGVKPSQEEKKKEIVKIFNKPLKRF